MENMVNAIGWLGAFCTTLSFLPQAIKVIKTRNTQSLSLIMYIVFITGTSLWTIYGVMKSDYVIIGANVVTTTFALMILTTKIRYG